MVNAPRLIVYLPDTRVPERRYILDVVFHDFLGLDYRICHSSESRVTIMAEGDQQSRRLVVDDVFLKMPENEWLLQPSLPSQPLRVWRVASDLPEARIVAQSIPVIYGMTGGDRQAFSQTDEGICLAVDLFGSAFFMLTRYEELVKQDRDQHNRFPATASLAYQEDFLERPIIDEYVEILWACIKRLWPGMERKKSQYHLVLSHDVDHPLATLNKSWAEVVKSIAGDVLRRADPELALRRAVARVWSAFGNYDVDPFNTFDFIMDVSEKNSISSTFFFLADSPPYHSLDGDYSLDLPWIRRLMRRIHSSGHRIGLHGSYDSFRDEKRVGREFHRLLDVTSQDGIEQDEWGSRQHYLRWETPATWTVLHRAGIDYDTTISYADHVGFRCGVSHEFAAYDLRDRRSLTLSERPLVVMETTLFGKEYMHLSVEEALSTVLSLSDKVKTVDGDLTILCHNSSLVSRQMQRTYAELVKACK